MVRWSSSAISLGFGAITLLCLGLLGWNIALQVQISTKLSGSPLEIVAQRDVQLFINSGNLTYLGASSENITITDASFFVIASVTIQTRQNGDELMTLYTFFSFPFNTTTGTEPIFIDVDIPASFLGTSITLALSSAATSGATGSIDPTFVVAKAFYPPQSQVVPGYPTNWIRLQCLPLPGAATQIYTSSTMIMNAITPS